MTEVTGQQENRMERPNHGPTQVFTIEELKVGNLYIYHFRNESAEIKMTMLQLLSLPAQSGVDTGIYTGQAYIMGIKHFSRPDLKSISNNRNMSSADAGLTRYPGNPGEYDPDRWLEDPMKMEDGHPNMTQAEALKIIKKRMSSNQSWWKQLKR